MKKNILLLLLVVLAACHHNGDLQLPYDDSLPPEAEGFVGLQNDHFTLDGETWFPLMLNYKAEIRRCGDSLAVVPAGYYHGRSLREHFDTIASWGFNAVRLCLDVLDDDMDSAAMFRATRRAIQTADSAGLRVMLLIKPPFEPYWQAYTKGLLRALADLPALWAYDFMNEPLYFDPVPDRDKKDAVRIAAEWRHWVRTFAPHQLFTVATAEPIEVFEWDPSMLPVDFVEMHTYHPLRVRSEMWWYSHYCGKPWMVGETGLPADNDSVPYGWQVDFMAESFFDAVSYGAIGYGWWEFQDCPDGVNFEAQYTGLRNSQGYPKHPEVRFFRSWMCLGPDDDPQIPANYYNMMGYRNICLTGQVIDASDGTPVEGAVVRGWNDDWSVGMNTFTDSNGRFTLYSNDFNVHFEVSAPGMSRKKFNRDNIRYDNPGGIDQLNLPNRKLEYQQIDYRPFMSFDQEGLMVSIFPFDARPFVRYSLAGDLGTIKLRKITQ